MPDMPTYDSKTANIKKLLAILAVAILLTASFLGTFVFFLPKLVSCDVFKRIIETRASNALNRRLQIETLKWDWSDGILIQNITLADDPVFSNRPLVTAKRAMIKIFFGDILNRNLRFDCLVDGIHAALIRNKHGQTNLDTLLAQFAKAKTTENKQEPLDLKNISLWVPVNIHGRVHISQIAVKIKDRARNKQLDLKDAVVRFDIPSLYLEPLTLKASADITVNGKNKSSARLDILVKNLFDRKGKLKLTDASIDVKGKCRGAELVFNSDLNALKLNSELQLDLGKMATIAEVIVPSQALPAKITGRVKFVLQGTGNPGKALSFNGTLSGNDIILSGGVLENKTLGPLNVNIVNSGVLDTAKGNLLIENGALDFLGKSRLTWRAKITDLYQAAPVADVEFGAIRLYMDELFESVKDFLPKGIRFVENSRRSFPILKMKGAGFYGPLATGLNHVEIKDLVVQVPKVQYCAKGFKKALLSADNVRFTLKDLQSTLKDFFPTRIDITAALIADRLSLNGNKEIQIDNLSVPDIIVGCDKISVSENPLAGLSARFKIQQTLAADTIRVPSLITINNFQQALDAEVALPTDKHAQVTIKGLKVTLPSLIIENTQYGPFTTNTELDFRVADISLLDTNPPDANIRGIKAVLLVGDVLTADFEAEAEHSAASFLKAGGTVSLNMASVSDRIISKVFDKLKLTGKTEIAFGFAGRLPNGVEAAKLGSGAIDVNRDLDFVDKLNIDCRPENIGVDLSVTREDRFKVAALSAESPVRYSFDNNTGAGRFEADLIFQGIQLPGHLFYDKRFGADIHISGAHQRLDWIKFSQTGVLKPVNIKHTLEASLQGLNRIFKRSLKMPLFQWLEHVAGTVRGTLNLSKETNLAALIDGLDAKGQLASGAQVQLIPGQVVRLTGWTTNSGLNLTLGKMLGVSGLKTNVHVKKNYHIISPKQAPEDVFESKPLSVSVLEFNAKPATGSVSRSLANSAAVAGLMGAVQNRFTARPSVAFKSACLGIGPLPLSVDNAIIGFDLNQGLPNSDYFQVGLLGGTVIGSIHIIKYNDTFALGIQLAFSGLDAAKLHPAPGADDKDDSELSGRLWAMIPLSSQIDDVLRELQLDLKLSRIGAKSLERFLYALDPFESNEAIVSQRQLLRTGFPRRIDITIKDGNLSLDGEMDVKGVAVAIPPLRRLNIANISGLDSYADYLKHMNPIIKVLKVCAADGIKISKDGRSVNFQTIK